MGHILDDLVSEVRVVGPGHLFAVFFLHIGGHIALYPLSHAVVAVGKDHLFIAGSLVDCLILDHSLLVHLLQHKQLPVAVVLQRPVADKGIIHRGIVCDGDEAGALRQSQVLGVLAEIHARGRLGTKAGLTEVGRVEVACKNLILIIPLFQLQRPVDLHHLALDSDLIVTRNVFDKLLGNGGAALHAPSGHCAEYGPNGALPVHALVRIKTLVLNGHNGLAQIIRDLVTGEEDAVFAVVEGLVKLPFIGFPILGIHFRSKGHIVGGQIHLHLILHGPVDIHGENDGEKDHGQHHHRENRSDDESHLASPSLRRPGASGLSGVFGFPAECLRHFPFYFFGALLQFVMRAFVIALVSAHNGAPSFLADFCISYRFRFFPLKTHCIFHFITPVKPKKQTFFLQIIPKTSPTA